MKRTIVAMGLLVGSGLGLPFMAIPDARASEAEALAAQKAFNRCLACHTRDSDPSGKYGPNLLELNGRVAGSRGDFDYSEAMQRRGQAGLVWNRDTLNDFLSNPKRYVKGTSMKFIGIRNADKRMALVDWLLGPLHSNASGALLGASAAALTGDLEYGEYLSGECVTCHKTSGGDSEIPAITQMDTAQFIHALYEYKTGVRANPVMQTVAKRLGDEEMAALAKFFETQRGN